MVGNQNLNVSIIASLRMETKSICTKSVKSFYTFCCLKFAWYLKLTFGGFHLKEAYIHTKGLPFIEHP